MSTLRKMSKIDRSMPMVVETEQISNRGNYPIKSRAEISDGLSDGIWRTTEEIRA